MAIRRHAGAVRAAFGGALSRIFRTVWPAFNEGTLRVWRLACALSGDERRSRQDPPRIRSVLHVSLISHKQFMLSRVLQKLGIRSRYLAINTTGNDRLDIGHDYGIPMYCGRFRRRLLEYWYLWFVMSRYDVIHFHFNCNLSGDDGWELPFLRRMNKLLVYHYRGCDARFRSRNMQLYPDVNLCQQCDYPVGSCDTPYQRSRMAMSQAFGDLFLVTTPDLLAFVENARYVPFIAPVGIDFDLIVPAPRHPDVFRIVTSSNHPGLDGVPYIRDAVNRLRREGMAVELIEVIKQPYREALAIYKSADLFAGKLRLGYYNNANIETMLMGIPNMAFVRDAFRHYAPDCPIIVARPETVYEQLREWVPRRRELKEIGIASREYVLKHHDPEHIVREMIGLYNAALQDKRHTLTPA